MSDPHLTTTPAVTQGRPTSSRLRPLRRLRFVLCLVDFLTSHQVCLHAAVIFRQSPSYGDFFLGPGGFHSLMSHVVVFVLFPSFSFLSGGHLCVKKSGFEDEKNLSLKTLFISISTSSYKRQEAQVQRKFKLHFISIAKHNQKSVGLSQVRVRKGQVRVRKGQV